MKVEKFLIIIKSIWKVAPRNTSKIKGLLWLLLYYYTEQNTIQKLGTANSVKRYLKSPVKNLLF